MGMLQIGLGVMRAEDNNYQTLVTEYHQNDKYRESVPRENHGGFSIAHSDRTLNLATTNNPRLQSGVSILGQTFNTLLAVS